MSGGTVGGGVVASVVTAGSTAYLGGNFGYVGPETGSFVPVDPASGDLVSPWPVVGGNVFAAIGDGFGGYYIGGSFASIGTTHVDNVAHIFFDGTLDTDWSGGTDGPVYALARSGSGRVTLYVGGAFTRSTAQSHTGLAAIDVNGALVPGFNPTVAGTARVGVRARVSRLDRLRRRLVHRRRRRLKREPRRRRRTSGTATAWNPKVDDTVLRDRSRAGRQPRLRRRHASRR